MFPANFIVATRVDCDCKAASKKRVLERVGELLATSAPNLSPEEIFEQLLERERLGSTGLGHGVALPHARMKGINQACGVLVRLESGVDYDSIDGQPVDLVFGLLVPHDATQEHLQLLAKLASLFSKEEFRNQLREVKECEAVIELMKQADGYQESA